MILTFPIQRSLAAAFVFENAKVVIDGRMIVNKAIFTPARNDRSRPAYVFDRVSCKFILQRKAEHGETLAWDRVQPYLLDTY